MVIMTTIRVLGPPSAHLPGSAVFLRKLPMQLCAYPVTVYFVVSVLATVGEQICGKAAKLDFMRFLCTERFGQSITAKNSKNTIFSSVGQPADRN